MQFQNFFILTYFLNFDIEKNSKFSKVVRKYSNVSSPRVLKLKSSVFTFESAYFPLQCQYQNSEFHLSIFVVF